MSSGVRHWLSALDWTTDVHGLPLLAAIAIAMFGVAVCLLAFRRRGALGGIAVVLIAAFIAGTAVDRLTGPDFAAERRALDARAFELTMRAIAPGSALACLDALAGETVEGSCEKALFATPEATAVAVSYVSAQLTLLAAGIGHARRAEPSHAMAQLQRAAESDRFGIVAHVLAMRDGCTVEQCGAFALLQDTSRVSANLAEQTFDSYVRRYATGWLTPTQPPVAANPPPAAMSAAVPARSSKNLFFPSAASIPPVSIMSSEPPVQPPPDTTGASQVTNGAAQAANPPKPGRKPQPQAQARPSPAPTANAEPPAPLQLAPNAQ